MNDDRTPALVLQCLEAWRDDLTLRINSIEWRLREIEADIDKINARLAADAECGPCFYFDNNPADVLRDLDSLWVDLTVAVESIEWRRGGIEADIDKINARLAADPELGDRVFKVFRFNGHHAL